VFRGRCLSAEVGVAEIAGGRFPITTYTFAIDEYLKGSGPQTISFRQIGTPAGGPADLGRLVGLPGYSPGQEYVLFLLPESRFGLTSPAGAGDGAFAVSGDRVRSLRAPVRVSPPPSRLRSALGGASVNEVTEMSYDALRRSVAEQLRGEGRR
jgi:hypothetical protein